jgi:hypothetical protein
MTFTVWRFRAPRRSARAYSAACRDGERTVSSPSTSVAEIDVERGAAVQLNFPPKSATGKEARTRPASPENAAHAPP